MVNHRENNHTRAQLEGPEDPVKVIRLDGTGQEIILIGVEQIGQAANGEVKRFIDQGWPDVVCLDLDVTRTQILRDQDQWESLTISTVIREKLLTALLLNLLVAAYQRKFDKPSTSMPGAEIYAAMELSEEQPLPVVLIDRNLHVTYSRAARSINFLAKLKMLLLAFKRLVKYQKITKELDEERPSADPMSAFIDEVTALEPDLKGPLIDERDEYSAQKIVAAPGNKVLAVVGAGRLVGIRQNLLKRSETDTAELEKVPETSKIGKWIKIIVPVVLIVGLLYLGWSQGREFLRENLLFWIAANSILTGLGAILAGAYILAILTAVIVAPFSPFIPAGPGTVAAIVQFIIRPPLVIDFQTFADDITHPMRWRKNRILKIFLIMILCGLGSILGTLLGTSRILFSLFSLE